MKNKLLALAACITAMATGISFYLANLSNPTEIQKQLSNTTNTITIAGATAIFGLLNDEDEDRKDP